MKEDTMPADEQSEFFAQTSWRIDLPNGEVCCISGKELLEYQQWEQQDVQKLMTEELEAAISAELAEKRTKIETSLEESRLFLQRLGYGTQSRQFLSAFLLAKSKKILYSQFHISVAVANL